MNWFDLLLLAIIAVHVIGGLIRGALKQLFGLFGFFAVSILAFLGAPYLKGFVAVLLRLFTEANPDGSSAVFMLPERLQGPEGALAGLENLLPADQVIDLAASGAAYILLLLLLAVGFWMLLGLLGKVNKIPVIGAFNRFGGALLGLFTALLLNFLIINLASILPVPAVEEALNGSQIAGMLKSWLPQLVHAFEKGIIDHFLHHPAGGGV